MPTLSRRNVYLTAGVTGVAYGLLWRLLAGHPSSKVAFDVMTVSFLFFMPMVTGMICALLAARQGERGASVWAVLPIAASAIQILAAFVLFLEGLICVAMMLPVALAMSLIGGGIGYMLGTHWPGGGNTPAACVAFLPFLVMPVEHWIGPQLQIREVQTSIDIHAAPSTVWNEIKRVRMIRPEEQRFSWTQKIGFPRPLEATLSGDGVGAVRHASFAGGLLFIETVTAWQPDQRLAFEIKADTANIPPGTLDEHVTVGGPHFDALEGEYRIEPLPGGSVRLHLSSRHRLFTTFNFYAHFWTDAIMRDIQVNILHIIRNRCEL